MNEKKTENTCQKNILLSLCKGNDAKGNDDDDDDDDTDAYKIFRTAISI